MYTYIIYIYHLEHIYLQTTHGLYKALPIHISPMKDKKIQIKTFNSLLEQIVITLFNV